MKSKIVKMILYAAILSLTFLLSAYKFGNTEITADDTTTGTLADNAPCTLVVNQADTTSTNETTAQSVEQIAVEEFATIGRKPLELSKGSISILLTTMPGNSTTTQNGTTITSKPGTTTTTQPGTTAVMAVVTSVKLNESKISLKVGENIVLNAAILPSNASDKSVSWVSSNPDIAFVDGKGEVVALKKGKSTITCTANGGKNVKATCEVTVKSGAVASYLYDERGFFYVEDNPWQRTFGFNRLYDFGAAYAVMYYNTVRVQFNYNGLDWMVQMWKGQYGYAFIGSEIGVYTKPQSRTLEHYDCASDDNSLKMEMSLYRNNKKLFTRDYATYWWTTGFVTGTILSSDGSYDDRTELVLTARITLKDADMTTAFVKAFEAKGFKNEGYEGPSTPDRFTVTGNDVYFCWRYLAQAPVTITFSPGNGSSNISRTMECGTTLIPPEFTRDGYTLTGWSPDMPSIVPVKNNTYTAKWKINSYTINFDANGGTGSVLPVTQQYNANLTLPDTGFEMEGYTFVGWNTTSDAAEPIGSYQIPAYDQTLYAVYKMNEEPSMEATTSEPVSD